ncbi:hypothetical protein QR680_007442 [Steinernema hermaphroditum]|uniref:Major facilitator superfamily (MFS) profile domain-containing protein n=1 Tax=Steinernema hermaphroditum TaxID=289476 RepID=A0AA39M655_9BILA|nr:hypothetical protein QR680_007442 [Steinernema hermaphroditum]
MGALQGSIQPDGYVGRPPLYSLESIRFRIVLLMMFAMLSSYTIRNSSGLTMVCMVNATGLGAKLSNPTQTSMDECPSSFKQEGLDDSGYNGEFLWSSSEQGLTFTAMSFGALLTTLPSGMLADKFGPKLIALFSISAMALLSYLQPFLADFHLMAFTIANFLIGACGGCTTPCMTSLASRWFPKDERSTLNAIYTSGMQLAGVLIGLVAPLLCSSRVLGGWPLVYYVQAFMATAWATLWIPFVSNHVENNRRIGEVERGYITRNTVVRKNQNKKMFPWRKALLSPPFLAVLLVRTTVHTQDRINVSYTATYIRDVLRTDLRTNGLYTSLPFVAHIASKILVSLLADYLKRRRVMSHTVSVRVFQLISNIGTALCFLGLDGFADCSHTSLGLLFLILRNVFIAFVSAGEHTSALSIAPPHSGTVNSASTFTASVVGTAALYLVGIVLETKSSAGWTFIFVSLAILNIISGLFFVIFGSADVQDWAKPKDLKNVYSVSGIDAKSYLKV